VKGTFPLMKNNLLGRLSVLVLSAAGAVCLLSLPGARAAEDAYGTMSTTAVFARGVQVHTNARWEKGGSVLPWSSGPPASQYLMTDLLSDRLSRLNPHAESLDVTLLYQLTDMISLYGGGRLLSESAPGSLKPWAAKFGLDFASPWLFGDRTIQPIGAAEFKSHKDYDWSTDFSLRAGLRWNDTRAPDRSLSLLLECFVGNSQSTTPVSQQKIDYLGLGLHYAW
jgi:Protein of unknown function (DUF1207)